MGPLLVEFGCTMIQDPEKGPQNWLLAKWVDELVKFDGPGDATIVDGPSPMGYYPADLTGLIVWDASSSTHQFRLYRDGSVYFIKCPEHPEAPIELDPILDPYPDRTLYETDGVPPAVSERIEALGLLPEWDSACPDGEHDFELIDGFRGHQIHECTKCEARPGRLSWLGHDVSELEEGPVEYRKTSI